MPIFDLSWGTNGIASAAPMATDPRAIAAIPDNGFVVAGTSGFCGQPVGCIEVVRYDNSGNVYAFRRISTTVGFGNAVAVYPVDNNTNVLVVGYTNGRLTLIKLSLAAATNLPYVTAFGDAGIKHHSFGVDGTDTFVLAAVASADKQDVFVSGYSEFYSNGSAYTPYLAKISTTTGALQTNFGDGGVVGSSVQFNALAFDTRQNRLYAAGGLGTSALVTRLDATLGTIDSSFGTNGNSTFQLGPQANGANRRADRATHLSLANTRRGLYIATRTVSYLDGLPINNVIGSVDRVALYDLNANALSSTFGNMGYVEIDGHDIGSIASKEDANRLYVTYSPNPRWRSYLADSGKLDLEFGIQGKVDYSHLAAKLANPTQTFLPGNVFTFDGHNLLLSGRTPARLSLAKCDVDIDADGAVSALNDGMLALRGLLGQPMTGVESAPNLGSLRKADDDRQAYVQLLAGTSHLDVDGDGEVKSEIDGLLLLRHLLGFQGDALVTGITFLANATRQTPAAIRAYFVSKCDL
jgi:hypothetical protein